MDTIYACVESCKSDIYPVNIPKIVSAWAAQNCIASLHRLGRCDTGRVRNRPRQGGHAVSNHGFDGARQRLRAGGRRSDSEPRQ